jgi:DNA mismatch endonuclease (patch repair protein)
VSGPDVFSKEKRSAVMRRVKGKNTSPELKVRKALTALGARYRLHRADLPGKPDVVMPGRRLALFVHGCFWHGHDCARGARVPKQNRDYWLGKVARNRARDAASHEALHALGWRVETFWECELKDEGTLWKRLRTLLSSPGTGEVAQDALASRVDGGGQGSVVTSPIVGRASPIADISPVPGEGG